MTSRSEADNLISKGEGGENFIFQPLLVKNPQAKNSLLPRRISFYFVPLAMAPARDTTYIGCLVPLKSTFESQIEPHLNDPQA